MNKTKRRKRPNRSDSNIRSRLDKGGSMVDRLIRQIGGGGIIAIVATAFPWNLEALREARITFFHARPLDSAEGFNLAVR